jgi:hypothetical protein
MRTGASAGPLLLVHRDSEQLVARGPPDCCSRQEGAASICTSTPGAAPQANAVAERFVRTVPAGCLDWLLLVTAASSCAAPGRLVHEFYRAAA